MEFYRCNHCGNIIAYIENSGVKVVCCGEKMQKLEAGTVDASHEKHIPQIENKNNKIKVQVGSVLHPMIEKHFIKWIAIESEKGEQIKYLEPENQPQADFLLEDDDKLVSAYAYCNLHGLWKS